MVEALMVSTAVLWAVVLVLAATVVALVRQVGVLHERVSPAGALVGREGPRLGEPAPRLTLPDWSGQPVSLGGEAADGLPTLLVFVSPTCPVCKTVLEILPSLLRGERARLVLASDGPRQEHEAFVGAHGLAARRYLLSADLGLVYQVPKLPYAVLIDAAGVLRAKGLVNTREHLESLFEAMELGVGSVQEFLRRSAPPPGDGQGEGFRMVGRS